MPQIQIIGQEKLAARMGARDRQLEREKMQQTAVEKAVQFKQMGEELKMKAKAVESEVERNRILALSNRMDYIAKTYDTAAKYDEPEKVVAQMFKISGDETMNAMTDPMVRGMTEKLTPVGSRYKNALAGVLERKAGMNQGNPGMNTMGSGNSIMNGGPNMPQANIVGGNMPGANTQQPWGSNEPIVTDMNESGATVNLPEELYNKNYYSGMGSEAAKPYSLEEGKVISSTGSVNSAIDNLTKLVNKGALKGLGAQTMTDIGNPLAAAGMPQETRDALNYMNQLKNLIPFARGGKQLTPYEAKLVFRLLNTQGKTPEMIIRDLNVYKREFNTMVKVISTPRAQLNMNDLTMSFGGGKSYEELTGASGSLPESGDPLGLF